MTGRGSHRVMPHIKKGLQKVRSFLHWLNTVLKNHYSAAGIAFVFTILAAAVIINALFIPPYLGYANDGSLDTVMQDSMLSQQSENKYFDYYERELAIVPNTQSPGTTPLPLHWIIRFSVIIDHAFSGDLVFDVRTLAAMYLLIYLPAVFLTLRTAAAHTRSFTFALLVSALGALILSDVSLITRFASLYAYPLEIILSLYTINGITALAQNRRLILLYPLTAGSIALLAQLNQYAGVSMFALSVLFIMLASQSSSMEERIMSVIMAVIIAIIGMVSLTQLTYTQSDAQKYNAMARGVLLTADDPEETLAAFGIEPRYATITDTLAEYAVPYARITAPAIKMGFLDRYTSGDIAAYYVSHPYAVLRLMDAGMRETLNARPAHIGNYEQSAQRPARSQALMFSFWSSFKMMIIPRTIGTLVILSIIAMLLLRKLCGSKGVWLMCIVLTLIGAIIVQWMTAVVFGGDALLLRQAAMTGFSFDLMLYLILAGSVSFLDRAGLEGTK